MWPESEFWRILTILLDTHFVLAILKYQNLTDRDENCFILLQMSQNYIPDQFEIHSIDFEAISRVQTPYRIVKIDQFLTIFQKLAQIAQTSPEGSRIYFQGFLDPINSFKPFLDHFEQFLKKSIFWVSDVFGPELTGSHHFPKAVFANV